MSGFERILAHVSSDALRDYCSSAIEDELKNLKEKMQSCLTTLEKALEVQDAILKLNVPLTENAATFAAIQSEHKAFNDDLDAFINEQKKVRSFIVCGYGVLLLIALVRRFRQPMPRKPTRRPSPHVATARKA